jgi:antitoxin (DNA-binding transcriptional repressor) of toxin-antitoxin stability system
MRTLTLKETRAPYTLALDDTSLGDEVVILEKDGQPVAALVPINEYKAFQNWREGERHRRFQLAELDSMEQEHAAFEQMQPELLKEHPGRVVAIYQGNVVAVGDDKMTLWAQVRQQLGPVPIYLQRVDRSPQIYKMPHRKVKH